jgi:hypothetical protein
MSSLMRHEDGVDGTGLVEEEVNGDTNRVSVRETDLDEHSDRFVPVLLPTSR